MPLEGFLLLAFSEGKQGKLTTQTVKRKPPPSGDVHPALRLVRVGNLGVSFAGTIVGGLVARGAGIGGSVWLWIAVLLAAVSTSLVTAGGNVLNDLLDREGDRTNHPDRPLVTGEISVRGARILATSLFVIGGAVVVTGDRHRPVGGRPIGARDRGVAGV